MANTSTGGGNAYTSSAIASPLPVTQGAFVGQPNSAAGGFAKVIAFPGGGQHRIHSTGAVNISGAGIGTVGTIGDTIITGISVTAACTVTLSGFFQDETGASAAYAVTMAGAGNVQLPNNQSLINNFAAATITCTVADVCYVTHGNYP